MLRVAAVRDAEYEWAQHVVLAGDAGIDDDEVARVADGPEAAGVGPGRRGARCAAVDELVADAAIARRHVGRSWPSELDDQQLMDVVFTVGAYDIARHGVPLVRRGAGRRPRRENKLLASGDP